MTWSAFPLLFLQASISCLATGCAAWALLRLAQRRWPGLAARRAPWLVAQLAGAVTLVLVMLPGAARFSLLPLAPWPGAMGVTGPAGAAQGGAPAAQAGAASAMAYIAAAADLQSGALAVAPTTGAAMPHATVDDAVAASGLHGRDAADSLPAPHAADHLPPLAARLTSMPVSMLASMSASMSASPLAAPLAAVLAWSWLACYGIGVIRHALRWRQARRDVRTLLCAADRLDGEALRGHPAFSGQFSGQSGGQSGGPCGAPSGHHAAALPPVLEIDAPVSPMLVGLLRPVLLLPRHLRGFPPAQQQLIVAHELTHLRRRDHLWQHAGALLQVVQWFVPAMPHLREGLQWAQELGCDRAVLARRPAAERRHYAAALLAQLAAQVQAGHGAPASPAGTLTFGTRGAQAVAERIRLVRDAPSAPRAPLAGAAALLLLPALCGATVALQPQFAWRDAGADAGATPAPGAGAPAPAPATRTTAPAWRAPLAQLRVNSEFGSINRPGGKPHGGIDLRARRGSAVLAPADGRVAVSTDAYEGGARYGKVIVIDHGQGMRTLYAHLGGRGVREGDLVRAGQRIALSGASGKVTGPHLHFEVWRDGVHLDPRDVLGTALATKP